MMVRGNDRKENIKKGLELSKNDIENAIKRKNSDTLFIKINAIDTKFPLACTHPEALDSALDFFYNKFDRIIVGDNTYVFSQKTNHPYMYLKEKFDKIEFSDLSEFGIKKINFKDVNGNNKEVHMSLLPEKAFTVSLALPKTHDAVVFTGCSKNMLGCALEGRSSVHGTGLIGRLLLSNLPRSISTAHENLATLISGTKPDFSILDGFVSMEGEGPLLGNEAHLGIALASEDCIALDSVAASIIGFDKVPYLDILSGKKLGKVVEQTEIIGDKFDFNQLKRIKKHHLYKYQILEKTSGPPMVDLRFLFSVLKRPHRIVPKAIKMIFKK